MCNLVNEATLILIRRLHRGRGLLLRDGLPTELPEERDELPKIDEPASCAQSKAYTSAVLNTRYTFSRTDTGLTLCGATH